MRLEDVAEELSVNMPQVRSLVRSGELPAIKVGGRGVWRVERTELEAYIDRQYTATREGLKQDDGGR
ncbi:helix-turn-helix domain-containing protein [Arthrobacter sp.]|uniref:helix-turn-helix domain-containing protein n=1 Tax=Arthrobacter sp. TaxID=1667 RepID=UPI003A8F364E